MGWGWKTLSQMEGNGGNLINKFLREMEGKFAWHSRKVIEINRNWGKLAQSEIKWIGVNGTNWWLKIKFEGNSSQCTSTTLKENKCNVKWKMENVKMEKTVAKLRPTFNQKNGEFSNGVQVEMLFQEDARSSRNQRPHFSMICTQILLSLVIIRTRMWKIEESIFTTNNYKIKINK